MVLQNYNKYLKTKQLWLKNFLNKLKTSREQAFTMMRSGTFRRTNDHTESIAIMSKFYADN
jgi:hypothetical protein